MSALLEVSDAGKQQRLAGEAVSRLTPAELLDWAAGLAALAPSKARDFLLAEVLGKLASTRPADAMKIALSLKPKETAKDLANRVAGVWAQADFRAMFDYAGGLPEKAMRESIGRIAVRAWADQNPDEAFRHLAGLRFDDGGILISTAANRLARQDVEKAIEMLDLVKDSQVWDTAAGRVFEVFVEQDPQKAKEWFFAQTDTKVKIPLAYSLGSTLASHSASESIEMLNQINDDDFANYMLHGMIQRLDKGDIGDLLQHISSIKNPDYQASVALSTSRDLSKTDPARAQDWIATLTDENTRAHAYQGAGMGLAEGDSQAGLAWVNSLPPGKDRRYAVFGFASGYSDRDPVTSAALAMTIQEPDVRERLVSIVLRNWKDANPAAAQAWAQTTGYQRLLK